MWSDDRAPLSAPATEPLSLSPNALLKNTENVNQSLQHRFLGFSIPFDAVIIIFIPGFFEYKNAVLWEICLDPCLKSFVLKMLSHGFIKSSAFLHCTEMIEYFLCVCFSFFFSILYRDDIIFCVRAQCIVNCWFAFCSVYSMFILHTTCLKICQYELPNLYAIERWLTKYKILYPEGPLLGFCSGYPVYPRACIQTLKTKERWLREGLQVKANELPAKMLEHSVTGSKLHTSEDNDCVEHEREPKFSVYGRWQLEPLHLPRAANGIVPKNERGQADVWSEKCLPPRIVHLRLPRVFSIAKRLEVDSAPAMVGFEFRNGRSMPVFEGICQRRREKAGRREENE